MNLNDKLKLEKTGMTHNQLKELRYHYVDRLVDNMTTKDLITYVFDDMSLYIDKLSESEFLEEASNFWDDGLDDVIEEIKEYANCDFKKPLDERTPTNINIQD